METWANRTFVWWSQTVDVLCFVENRLNDNLDRLATANGVHCYGYVLKSEDEYILRKALKVWENNNRRPRITSLQRVEDDIKKFSLKQNVDPANT